MTDFRPTYLYIKQHSITGKLYFGKTIQNPESYPGSGKHWKAHVNKHGKEHIVTLWYCLFLDQESCTEFALNFSQNHNVVNSSDWLNMKDENGLDGGFCKGALKGVKKTKEHKQAMSKSRKQLLASGWSYTHTDSAIQKLRTPKSEETKLKMRKPKSEEHRQNMAKNNAVNIKCSCLVCNKVISAVLINKHYQLHKEFI